jgi:hypothetical protein
LAGALDRAVNLLKGFLGEDAVVADALDFEQSTVRAEASNHRLSSLDAWAWSRHP